MDSYFDDATSVSILIMIYISPIFVQTLMTVLTLNFDCMHETEGAIYSIKTHCYYVGFIICDELHG